MLAALGASDRPLSPFAFEHACCLPVHSLGSGPLLARSADRIGVVELVGCPQPVHQDAVAVSEPEKKSSAGKRQWLSKRRWLEAAVSWSRAEQEQQQEQEGQ
jgi:hypothetical protein